MNLNTLLEKIPEMNRNTRCNCEVQKLSDQFTKFMIKNVSHDTSTGCLLANAQNHMDIQI